MQLIFHNGLTRNSNFFSACTIELKIYMRHLQNEALNLTFSSCLFSSRWGTTFNEGFTCEVTM